MIALFTEMTNQRHWIKLHIPTNSSSSHFHFSVNSGHKASYIVRNPFNDVGKNGIPWPI